MNSFSKLTVNDLSKSFKGSGLKVLDSLSIHVDQGELVSLIGPSGSGKSTLLDCIAGLSEMDNGDILLDDRSIEDAQGHVAYMFQDDVMFPWRTVLENVMLPLEIKGIHKTTARNEAQSFLKLFGLESFESFYPFMLSGGMKERAALLRTYLYKKDVMLLDEPFSKLDALTRQKMQQWFLEIINKKKKSVLFVTHDVDEAIFLSDRIYVLSKRPGKILAEISVKIKKPRSIEISTSKEFITIKKLIMHTIMYNKNS